MANQSMDLQDANRQDDEIKLRSGREIYAHGGILGISPDLKISHGLDGSISIACMPDLSRAAALTSDELDELCDIAIDRWQRLKALVASLPETRPEV